LTQFWNLGLECFSTFLLHIYLWINITPAFRKVPPSLSECFLKFEYKIWATWSFLWVPLLQEQIMIHL
jgi:hypothetical protein